LIIASVVFSALFLAPDSPLALTHNIYFGTVLVLVFSCLYYHFDRSQNRAHLEKRERYLPRVASISLSNQSVSKARVTALQEAMDKLDFSFVGSKLFQQNAIAETEHVIIDLVENANEEELNYMITNIKLALLIYKVKDSDAMAPNKKSRGTRTRLLVSPHLCFAIFFN
jgi:hypothetical protein